MMAAILGLEMCAVLIPLRVIDWFWQHKSGRGAWAAYLAAAFGLSLGAFWAWGLKSAALTVWLWFIIAVCSLPSCWAIPEAPGPPLPASGRRTGCRGSSPAPAAPGRRFCWPSISRSCPRAWAFSGHDRRPGGQFAV